MFFKRILDSIYAMIGLMYFVYYQFFPESAYFIKVLNPFMHLQNYVLIVCFDVNFPSELYWEVHHRK